MGRTVYRCSLLFLLVFMGPAVLSSPLSAQPNPMPQTSDSVSDELQPLDPDEPMTEFPDFGVDWPDMDLPAEQDSGVEQETGAADSDETAQSGSEIDNARDAEPLPEAENDDFFQPEDVLAERGYKVQFYDLPEDLGEQFFTRFDTLSVLQQYKGEDANFAQIKRRAETDRELVEQLLEIEGYYDAVVRTRFAVADGGGAGDISVAIEVRAGPQYRLDDIIVNGLEKAVAEDVPRFRSVFGLQTGEIINSDQIMDARQRLDNALAEGGYPFANLGEPELVIDHADRIGDLDMDVLPGGRYNFGSILMGQTDLFGADHVQSIARFDQGDLFKASDVEDLRRALIATGLVSTITLDPVLSQEPGAVDLAVNLTPAPLRTIAGEVGYGTGEGVRAEVSWEHRNFFPPEGLIRLTGVLATQEQAGSITFRRNNFRRRDNVLNGRVALSNIDRPAFSAQTFSISANVERLSNLIYQKRWGWSAGVELLASRERDISGAVATSSRNTFLIGALPATLIYDASDDLLDPRTGFRLGARVSPEASFQDGSFFYVRNQIDASAYQPISEKVVFASRARLGSIIGAGNNRIAPSRRLYSGGGGSVRGFGYQRIGPRDVNNEPVGGRSLAEFSLEARVRLDLFGGNFSVVPFFDGGNVYTDSFPDFSGFRYGAGIGVRYHSDFGPIRVDVGTPINPQPGDSRIAVYVSLGQAF